MVIHNFKYIRLILKTVEINKLCSQIFRWLHHCGSLINTYVFYLNFFLLSRASQSLLASICFFRSTNHVIPFISLSSFSKNLNILIIDWLQLRDYVIFNYVDFIVGEVLNFCSNIVVKDAFLMVRAVVKVLEIFHWDRFG